MENFNDTLNLFINAIQKSNPNYWYFIFYWSALFLITYFLVYITEPKDKKGYLIGRYGKNLFSNIFIFIVAMSFAAATKEFGGSCEMNSINYFVKNIFDMSSDIVIISLKYIGLAFIISKVVKSPDGGGSSVNPLIVIMFFFVMYYGDILNNQKNHEDIGYLEIILLILAINLGATQRNAIDRFGIIDKPYDESYK